MLKIQQLGDSCREYFTVQQAAPKPLGCIKIRLGNTLVAICLVPNFVCPFSICSFHPLKHTRVDNWHV